MYSLHVCPIVFLDPENMGSHLANTTQKVEFAKVLYYILKFAELRCHSSCMGL